MTTVAVVGLGRMGSSMTRALAASGLELIVQNRTPQRAAALAGEIGCGVADRPADAAARADVVITMLADDAAVEAVIAGPDGVIEGIRPGAVVVDMSTIRPETIRALGPTIRARGGGLLDAPVSGSTSLAEAGQLTLMVGGEATDLERARPALEPLARTIFHLGPLGTGAAMKLAVNAIVFGLNGALSEGLVLAEAAGIERSLAYDVIAASAVGAPLVAYKRAAFLEPDATPVAFALELAEKDLRLILGFADALGVDVPQATANLALIREASTGDRGSRDFASVAAELRDRSARRRAARASGEAPLE